jgi:hypothetical protein
MLWLPPPNNVFSVRLVTQLRLLFGKVARLPLGDVILAQPVCPLNDIIFSLHWEKLNGNLNATTKGAYIHKLPKASQYDFSRKIPIFLNGHCEQQ